MLAIAVNQSTSMLNARSQSPASRLLQGTMLGLVLVLIII
ncbi:hypothetical protein EMIT0P44_80103 [Pseudomonas sp. IT-P44]